MILTEREVSNLNAYLYRIRIKAGGKKIPRNTIENLCNKCTSILKKAGRKRQPATRLHFEIGDF